MARDDPSIYLRIPADLKTTLDESSVANRRSLTAEVVARLTESYANEAAAGDDEKMAEVFERLQRDQESALRHVALVRDLLARAVVRMAEELAPSLREKAEFEIILQTAQSVLSGDATEQTKAYTAQLKGATKESVARAAAALAESNAAAPQKKWPK